MLWITGYDTALYRGHFIEGIAAVDSRFRYPRGLESTGNVIFLDLSIIEFRGSNSERHFGRNEYKNIGIYESEMLKFTK